jgi:hypothetical protein
MSNVPAMKELREQAVDYVRRLAWPDEIKPEHSLIIGYMAAFARDVLILREAGIDWREGKRPWE